jgi:hypothetical protein
MERTDLLSTNRRITQVTVEWSDGRRYSLKPDYLGRLFSNKNPMSAYLALAFSPEVDGGGWLEEDGLIGTQANRGRKQSTATERAVLESRKED